MFRGSIPADMRSILVEWVKGSEVDEVAVTTSGNLTVERAIVEHAPTVHSNDVNIYSCALGWWFAERHCPMELKPETAEALPWLDNYMDGGAGTLACVMLGSGQPSFFKAAGSTNPYYARVLKGIERQFPEMHAKTVDKIRNHPLQLASFHPIDVREYVRNVPDTPVISFPPFFAGDYESQFKPLSDALDWPEPEYPELDQAGIDALLEDICDREHWLLGLHIRRERLDGFLRGKVQTTNRGVPIYIYSSGGRSRVVKPRQSTEIVPNRRLMPGDELGDDIKLAPLSAGQFATLRSQYMNHNIKPGTPFLAVAVLIDGKVIGAFALGPSNHHPTTAYMLSDFPVAPTDYTRLSKLIIYCAMSREARLLLQQRAKTEMRKIRTTAFTNNMMSMKYRGAGIKPHTLELEKREKAPPDEPHEYMLNYAGEMGHWTLAEGLAHWKAKHGKKLNKPRVEAAS